MSTFELEVLGDIATDQTNEADIFMCVCQLGGVDIRIGIEIYVYIRGGREGGREVERDKNRYRRRCMYI